VSRSTSVWFLLAAILFSLPSTRTAPAAEIIDYNRDIRPLLSDTCFNCHGPDEKKRKAKLRLDTREGMLRAIVPGKPGESELLLRINSDDPMVVMPPPKSGKSLKPQQKELLQRWIEQGANWSSHWAFIPPVKQTLPVIRDLKGEIRNDIDRFIVARLEQAKLRPAREADPVTLLRRASLDLIGLPPTPAEVDAFLADKSPDAYEKQVDRLVASPHYGERWARTWLDGARYADSDGYEKDKPRFVWPYRDWVINALNRNLPYDRFVIEQIAGDLLPNATQDQIVATGFLRNSMVNEEGGVDPEQFRMEALFDRMDALGKSVLGLTVQCAQCHNHKYDPLTQEEYYRMFSFLNNTHEANIAVYSPADLKKRSDLLRKIAGIEGDLRHRQPDWQERMTRWEESVKGNQPQWVVVAPEVDEISTGGQRYLPRKDGSFLAQGYAPTKHRVKLTVKTDLPKIAAIRLELLTDPNLPLRGPGRSIKGTAALSEFEVEAAPADAPDKKVRVKFSRATADVEVPETPLESIFDDKSGKKRIVGPVSFAIDGNNDTAWGIDVGPGRRNQERKAVFTLATPIANASGTVLTFQLAQMHGGWNSDDNQSCNLGRFRLSITSTENAVADPLPQRVREILAIAPRDRSPAQVAAVFSYWRTVASGGPEWKDGNARIEQLWREHPESASQLVLQGRDDPRDTRVLERGDFLKPRNPVLPGVPAFLHPLPKEEGTAGPTRLTFARWLVDQKSPTTARALVNRVWQSYFGTGLVSTCEDFGIQADAPTHPQLLDHLAVEFMESGWNLKALHRRIVTSATYRQSSKLTPELAAVDPANRLLARGPRFRVEAEAVRDIALTASGLLNPKVGGPSVYPDAPGFLFVPPASYGPKVWKQETGADRYRRALYTFRFRSVPYPMLQNFDAPNGDSACVRRVRSNTPLQALTTLNEPIFLECARALAMRTVQEGGKSDADRLAYAFRCCVARKPNERETTVLLKLLTEQTQRFDKGGLNPWELAAADPQKPPTLPAGVSPAQLAGWTAVARVLLNLDETITKE
jgi:Protein of unknown function (DUF1553)/Protein of unknown function (DUF1549)/Planctomycete cytochrome C